MFSHKSCAFINDYKSGLWVVEHTERVFRTCEALFTAAYEHYKLWYVTTENIEFARRLYMDMLVVFSSLENVRELFEMLEVIDRRDSRS